MARSACIKAAIIAAGMIAGPVFADDAATCADDRAAPDQRIEACTRWIQSRPPARSDRAVAHNNRGYAFSLKKDYDRAIADFSIAVRLDAGFALALTNRGRAWLRKGA